MTAAAPAVTADPASQAQPALQAQFKANPQFPAEQQMAILAAFSPEVIATLVALAQAAGSLPKPADSNPTTAEASGKAKRKPAGAAAEPQAVGSCKSKQPKEDRSQKVTARPSQIKKERSDRAAAKSRQIKEELSERMFVLTERTRPVPPSPPRPGPAAPAHPVNGGTADHSCSSCKQCAN